MGRMGGDGKKGREWEEGKGEWKGQEDKDKCRIKKKIRKREHLDSF